MDSESEALDVFAAGLSVNIVVSEQVARPGGLHGVACGESWRAARVLRRFVSMASAAGVKLMTAARVVAYTARLAVAGGRDWGLELVP